ncbi:MAG: TadE/TadG family type IV pilus assembly protein [Steroidobacteraceae bacterium]
MTIRCAPRRDFAGPSRERGIAAVEFVITAPLIIFLLLAGAELGRAFVHYTQLSQLVRDAARYVSEHSINGTTGVVSISTTTITRARNLAVYGNIVGTGDAMLPQYQPSHVQVVNAGGDNIRVDAIYPYQPMLGATLPRFGIGSGSTALNFTMHIAVTMRAISSGGS